MKRAGMTIFVVLLVGLSGCTGISPFADSSTESGSTPSIDASSTDGASATTTKQATPDQSVKRPAGWGETGVSKPMHAYERHYAALYSYDNFTRTKNWTFFTPNQSLHSVARIDQSEKQQHWNTTVTDAGALLYHQEEYQKGNMLYLTNRSDPPTYNKTSSYSFDTYMKFKTNRRFARSGPVQYALMGVEYTDSERIVYEGETMFRYRTTQPPTGTNIIDFVPLDVTDPTIESFNMSTIVDSDGLIRSVEYEITYTTQSGETHTRTGTFQLDVTGKTTVKEPAWVEEAKTN